jgi:hypothetical protein
MSALSPHAYASGSQTHRGARPNDGAHARADLSSLEAGTAHLAIAEHAQSEQQQPSQLHTLHAASHLHSHSYAPAVGAKSTSPPRMMRYTARRSSEGLTDGELLRPGQVVPLMPIVPMATVHAPSRIPRHGKLKTGGAATARAAAGPNFFVGSSAGRA